MEPSSFARDYQISEEHASIFRVETYQFSILKNETLCSSGRHSYLTKPQSKLSSTVYLHTVISVRKYTIYMLPRYMHGHLLQFQGRDIAQAVSRRLSTVAARVRARVRSCGVCGGQSGTEAGFFRVLWLPLPILIPTTAPHSPSSVIQG
jgi:hypothetical protein